MPKNDGIGVSLGTLLVWIEPELSVNELPKTEDGAADCWAASAGLKGVGVGNTGSPRGGASARDLDESCEIEGIVVLDEG